MYVKYLSIKFSHFSLNLPGNFEYILESDYTTEANQMQNLPLKAVKQGSCSVNLSKILEEDLRSCPFFSIYARKLVTWLNHSWQRLHNPHIFWRALLISPTPLFFEFCPTPLSLLFLLPCFFGWMCDHATTMDLNWSSFGTLLRAAPCCVFFETDDMVFASILI